jgi:hypothetical protein
LELTCDVCVVALFENVRLDRIPLVVRELRERYHHISVAVAQSRNRIDRVVIKDQWRKPKPRTRSRLNATLAITGSQHVAGDSEQPLVRAASRRVIARERLKRAGERLSCQIGCEVRPAGRMHECQNRVPLMTVT